MPEPEPDRDGEQGLETMVGDSGAPVDTQDRPVCPAGHTAEQFSVDGAAPTGRQWQGADTAPLTESCIGLNRLRRLSAMGVAWSGGTAGARAAARTVTLLTDDGR